MTSRQLTINTNKNYRFQLCFLQL